MFRLEALMAQHYWQTSVHRINSDQINRPDLNKKYWLKLDGVKVHIETKIPLEQAEVKLEGWDGFPSPVFDIPDGYFFRFQTC